MIVRSLCVKKVCRKSGHWKSTQDKKLDEIDVNAACTASSARCKEATCHKDKRSHQCERENIRVTQLARQNSRQQSRMKERKHKHRFSRKENEKTTEIDVMAEKGTEVEEQTRKANNKHKARETA